MRPLPRLPSRSPVDLRGKRILVTGASSGIGAAAAEKFAAEGATVIIVARRAELLAEVAGRITARGGEAIAIPTNLVDMDAVDALVQQRRPCRHPDQQCRPVDPPAADGIAGALA